MLTPQAIKDQEFQVKFRGYDAIEVKSYLELLAEDFFELHEQSRVQVEEIESLVAEQESTQRAKERLESEVKAGQENSEEIQSEIEDGYKHKDQKIEELKAQLEESKKAVEDLEEKNNNLEEEVAKLQQDLFSSAEEKTEKLGDLEKLQAKLEQVEDKNRELNKEGVDFKTTILAAQSFADNLRETSERDARSLMDEARTEVEQFQAEAQEELTALPKEIEALKKKKVEVHDELRAVLESYLENLNSSSQRNYVEGEDDLSDLFQSIQIPGDEDVDPDDIDNINMDLT